MGWPGGADGNHSGGGGSPSPLLRGECPPVGHRSPCWWLLSYVLMLVLVRRVEPKWFLAALVVTTFLGWAQFSTSVGRVNLRLTDLPYLVLLGSLLFVSGRPARRGPMSGSARSPCSSSCSVSH